MEIDVVRGHSKGPECHCFDGDSVYVTSGANVLVRLTGIDAPEVRGMSLYYLKKSGFLNRLNYQLRKWLNPRLTQESIRIHKQLGFKARKYLENILEEELVVTLGQHVFDRYERPLVYLAGNNQDSYNYKMVETGLAIPYFIYPNAVSLTEKGKIDYTMIEKMRNAAVKAHEDKLGLWAHIEDILLPKELRFLTRREYPVKYCADLVHNVIHPPQHYFKGLIEDQLYFYSKDVVTAVLHGFRPVPACPEWMHKLWRVLFSSSFQRRNIKDSIKRRNKIKKI